MANLRLNRIKTSGNRRIIAEFSENLVDTIGIGNIEVKPIIESIPVPEIISVDVLQNILRITTQPMTPYAEYKVIFKSTSTSKFKSIDNNFIFEDNKTNLKKILGPAQPSNVIKSSLEKYLDDQIYDINGTNLISNILESQSSVLSKGLYDIGQLANDNYLEHTVVDERKIRGKGPYDRLNQEGAFEVVRVGLNETNHSKSISFDFESFPREIITLKKIEQKETLIAGNGEGTFNNIILNVKRKPITKLLKLIINYENGSFSEYDISKLGYRLKDSTYDSNFSSTLFNLKENQIQLNEEAFGDNLIYPGSGDTISVTYEYKSLGRQIDEESVEVTQIINSVREVVPPIITEFSLNYAPIVTSEDNIAETGGVVFLNPRSCIPFSENHPAFIKEIPYRLEGLPSVPGEYSIDYENGRVFVYGEETNDGTGAFPPIATYKYRSSFSKNLDYTYNPETGDLAASPLRELIGKSAKIKFNYEDTLVPGIDYESNVHVESINERIDNRLTSLVSLRTLHSPITNVFRVINETSGEIYPVQRFNDTTIFFTPNKYPRIKEVIKERANFKNILNETLIRNSEFINTNSVRVLKINLNNKNIINSSGDAIGASFNSSVILSRNDIFKREVYFDYQVLSENDNINKLFVGDYAINYKDGKVYVGVENNQPLDVGTINYKAPIITTNNNHIISVSRVYHNIDTNDNMSINLDYEYFSDSEIVPTSFQLSDERFLNNNELSPYLFINGQISVSDNIKNIRGIFDVFDLNNNNEPINFADIATFSGNVININDVGINQQSNETVGSSFTISIPEISPGMEIVGVSSVIRTSDGKELWDSFGTFSGFDIVLSGANSPTVGDQVTVIYQINLNGGSTPVVDYDRGDYFVDYSYLQDEILVSYEYGDNVIDFRRSNTVDENTEYYVTYKVGALRNALFSNFGTLVDLPIMSSFDTSFDRERYRDALQAALQSFTKGPTLPSMKQLVSNITKIEPDIVESVFELWSLGISSLYQDGIKCFGEPTVVTGKFDNGVLFEKPGQSVSFDFNNHIRLEDGSIEMWTIPEWDGLDNDATIKVCDLTCNDIKVSEEDIWIGSRSYHPKFDNDGCFSISRFDEDDPTGLPSSIFTKSGVFIYYDEDIKRWKLLLKNSIVNVYTYSGKIITSGEFYDVKFIQDLQEDDDVLRSLTKEIYFTLNINQQDSVSPDGYTTGDGYQVGNSFDGISFMSDDLHYLIDIADPAIVPENIPGTIMTRVPHPSEKEAIKRESRNRISIYKDGRGFLNLEVFDKNSSLYKVSSDISNWKSGEKHLIGASWKINTFDKKDEIHLFVDGFEVPNVLRYGGRPKVTLGDRFREVKPEIVIGTISKKIIKGNNLSTIAGENVVFSPTVNFESEGIVAGDTIDIIELGFGQFNIISVTNNELLLDSPVPGTLSDGRFSTNIFTQIVSNEVDLSANIAVSIIDTFGNETEIPGLRSDFPAYRVDKNSQMETVFTLYGPANVGDNIAIRTLGLNHRRCRESVYLWGDNQSILKTQLPPPINLNEVKIKAVILPLMIISPDNSAVVSGNYVASGIVPTKVTNEVEGRELSVRITGGNVDFSTPVEVQISGVSDNGNIETLIFNSPEIKTTTNRWRDISDITVTVKPISTTQNSIGIEIKEALSLTNPGLNDDFPIIRYSYQEDSGDRLVFNGTHIEGIPFRDTDVGKKIVITYPIAAAGTYEIIERLNDDGWVSVSPNPPIIFTDGKYKLFNTTIGRSGFKNGFFTFEKAGVVNQPYPLPQGKYEFDYSAYLEIPFINVHNHKVYIGSDFNLQNQSKSVIDEFRSLSKMISDVRVGESLVTNTKSFTSDFVALRPFEPDSDTLSLIHFDESPFINDAPIYTLSNKEFIQSGESINSNFNESLVITERPIIIENNGSLSTRSEGSVEFWVSPKFDTYNDPVKRFYFDASSAVVEELNSSTSGLVKISGRADEIISVRLLNDTQQKGIDYYVNGSIDSDSQSINLGISLPGTQVPVIVTYVPKGSSGDRISIFKDELGFLTFNVTASGNDFQVRQPIFWQRNTWHRVFVSFKFNRRDNKDELRLFVDGRESGTIRFGQGFLFGQGLVFSQNRYNGEASKLIANIDFKDIVNKIFIGSSFRKTDLAASRFENIKISNIARKPLICSGIPVDENYQSNLNVSLPVVRDLYTLYLNNFDTTFAKNKEFAILRDEQYGIFNFIINVIDSFKIVQNDKKVNQVLEELILALKPANSRVDINIVR